MWPLPGFDANSFGRGLPGGAKHTRARSAHLSRDRRPPPNPMPTREHPSGETLEPVARVPWIPPNDRGLCARLMVGSQDVVGQTPPPCLATRQTARPSAAATRPTPPRTTYGDWSTMLAHRKEGHAMTLDKQKVLQ